MSDRAGPAPRSVVEGGGGTEVEVAVLDRAGVIVSTNQAWRDFATENGGDPGRTGVGVSYLAVCDTALGDPATARVGAAIRSAVAGLLVLPERVLLDCPGPDGARWFEVVVSSRWSDDGTCPGAIVALVRRPGPDPPDPDVDRVPGTPGRSAVPGPGPGLGVEASASVLDALPDGVAVVSARGLLLHVNAELEHLSGHRAEDLVGRPVEVLVPPRGRERHGLWRVQYSASPTHRVVGREAPLELLRADGSTVPVEISLAPTRLQGERVTVAGVRDLRPRQHLEQALDQARVDQERLALLEERQRIARDLHDTVIQDLFAIGLQLDGIEDPQSGDLVDQLDVTLRRLRGLVLDLGPPPRRDRLSQVLHALVNNAARALGFAPDLVLRGPVDDLPDLIGDNLVAVLQESLANIARHAAAQQARVTLSVGPEQVRLGVEDDGVGISDQATVGYGLDNLRYRAGSLAGRLRLSARDPSGTRLELVIPLPPPP